MVRGVRLVVNPAAACGQAARHVPGVVAILRGHGLDVEVFEASAEDAEQVAAEAGPDTLVCSLGGEGTHARVASGAYVSGALFTPLPGGRGNDLVRAVGLPTDPYEAARRLATATERRIDLGDAGGAPFLGVVSIGASAIANDIANDSRIGGPGVYHVAATRMLRHVRPTAYRLDLDGEVREVVALDISIGLSGMYGGGLRVCPDALLDDGLLDVTVIRASKWRFVQIILGMRSGHLRDVPGIDMYRAKIVHVEGQGPFYADGAQVGNLPVTATVSPRALRLLA